MAITSRCKIVCVSFIGMPFNWGIWFHVIRFTREKKTSPNCWFYFDAEKKILVQKRLSQQNKMKFKKKETKKRVSFPLQMESTTHVQLNQYSLEYCIKEKSLTLASIHADK